MMSRFGIKLFSWICFFHVVYGTLRSPTVKLLDGNEMPIVGFGTHFRTPTEEEEAVMNALKTGYRLFDTANAYKNEKNLGKVLKKWFSQGGKREEVFIITKLPVTAMRPADVQSALEDSLSNMGLDYVDLYLVHVPMGVVKRDGDFEIDFWENGTVRVDYDTDIVAVWKEMEQQVRAGRARSIGLSSFNVSQVSRIWNAAEIKPVNLQVEGNVYLQQRELRRFCKNLGIVVTAFGPLGSSDVEHVRRRKRSSSALKHPVVRRIADEHGVPVGQVLLRYLVELGFAIIPKSGNPERMRENLDLFGFELSQSDMTELEKLDQDGRIRKFDYQTLLKGIEHHPEYPFSYRIPRNE